MAKHLSTAALAAISLAAGLGITEARADLNVFVGYADNLRASGFFPTPWLGGSGVVSESSSAQSFDTGAVRVDNTGASSVTISGMTVTLNGGGVVYNFWNPLDIPAGDTGIFTQTFSYNFDSSDNGSGFPIAGTAPTVPGNNGIGGCSSPAGIVAAAGATAYCASVVPVVSFTVNGNPAVSFNDTGQILDTGNYDFINGSSDGNEFDQLEQDRQRGQPRRNVGRPRGVDLGDDADRIRRVGLRRLPDEEERQSPVGGLSAPPFWLQFERPPSGGLFVCSIGSRTMARRRAWGDRVPASPLCGLLNRPDPPIVAPPSAGGGACGHEKTANCAAAI